MLLVMRSCGDVAVSFNNTQGVLMLKTLIRNSVGPCGLTSPASNLRPCIGQEK